MEEYNMSNATWCTNLTKHPEQVFCVIMQTFTIPNSNVRVYDLVILLFNFIFLLFLLTKLIPTIRKLRLSWPLFSILYCLIFLIPLVCCIHCVLAMILKHSHMSSKILHYLLRGTILVTEISVVVFGLAIKYYQKSIYRLVTTMISIVLFCIMFFITQLLMDIFNVFEPDVCKSHHLFTHGGVIFQFSTSTIFTIAYMLIFCLYLFGLYKRWDLPTKKSFYRYALFLSFVNAFQAIGSMLWYLGKARAIVGHIGVCFTMVTSVIYLLTFAPVVYWIFLSNYYRMTKSKGPDDGFKVNSMRSDGSQRGSWVWKWSLKPTTPINVPAYINADLPESSKLINKSTPTDQYSCSYSSFGSDDVIN